VSDHLDWVRECASNKQPLLPTCIGQEDQLVILLEDVIVPGIQVRHVIISRKAATQSAVAEAPPDIPVLHAYHLWEVTDVKRHAVRCLLENGSVYAGHSRLQYFTLGSLYQSRVSALLNQLLSLSLGPHEG